jgi:hypothetical protein
MNPGRIRTSTACRRAPATAPPARALACWHGAAHPQPVGQVVHIDDDWDRAAQLGLPVTTED